ncbi:MAG: polysaccharide deacetylase family protein [Chromatiales bacterium]|jgi:allantoinase|nr:polysaccharide deacetylase family protein [Chromatiales bacterium]
MDIERVPYSAIARRPRFDLPNDARVALWVIPNIEHYEYLPRETNGRNPWPRMPHPDVLGYGLRDYGNRVGLWRMLEVLDRYALRCTTSLSMSVYEHYPDIFEACESRGWDTLCHGMYNTRYHWGLDEDTERAYIADCVDTYRRLTGRQLAGWFGPATSQTVNTPDLVAEAGIRYYTDWFHDDQPFPMRVRRGQLITVPYTVDLNDFILERGNTDAAGFARMIKDYFDTVYREGEAQPRVMAIALHPFIMGQPHRLRYLDEALDYILGHEHVWQATGAEIADWYTDNALAGVEATLAMEEGR